MNAQIVHFDLPVTQLERAKAFYGQIFGWKFTPMGPNYHLIEEKEQSGGIYEDKTIEGRKPPVMPVIYFGVQDIQTTLKLAQSLGATIETPKTEISGGHGFFAILRDHDQNAVGIWNKT